MTTSSILRPLLDKFREDAHVDFIYSQTRPIPCWPGSVNDVSDTRLADELHHAFCRTGYTPLRHIGVDHHDGQVVLQGRVPTYYLKQIAQSMAASFPGVHQVHNDIQVTSPK